MSPHVRPRTVLFMYSISDIIKANLGSIVNIVLNVVIVLFLIRVFHFNSGSNVPQVCTISTVKRSLF